MADTRDTSEPPLSVAVVIPAYNAGETIERTLASVLEQTRAPDEIIVADDGSDDDTAARAERMSPDIRVLRCDHGGSSAARNIGTRSASSTYVAYLDADDTWTPNKLEVFESVARALNGPAFIFSDFRRYSEATQAFRPLTNSQIFPWIEDWPGESSRHEGRTIRQLQPRDALKALLKGYPIWPSTVLVRRAAVEAAGGWDPRFVRCQDFDLWLRLVSRAGMVYIADPMTIVHVHAGHGEAYEWISRQLEWDLKVLEHHCLPASPLSAADRRLARLYLGRRTVHRGDLSRRYGRWREALRWYAKAMTLPGGRLRGAARLIQAAFATAKP